MKQFWKCYHVFLAPTWLKWLMYLVYPLIMLGVFGWLLSRSVPGIVIILLASVFIVTVEIFLDSVVFEGIASKDTNKLEYLKTSVRGMNTLRNSVIADAIRRVATVTIVLGSLELMKRNDMGISIIAIFVTLGSTELGLIITRSITMMIGRFLAIYLGSTLCMWSLRFLWVVGNIWGNVCIACGFYLMVAAVGRIIIMRRARGSYYDK